MDTGLINGKNTYGDGGSRYEANFEAGKKYRLRLINGAIDTHFKFSIDNHTLTVIANDFVPIVPFTTDVLDITMGEFLVSGSITRVLLTWVKDNVTTSLSKQIKSLWTTGCAPYPSFLVPIMTPRTIFAP